MRYMWVSGLELDFNLDTLAMVFLGGAPAILGSSELEKKKGI